MGSDAAAIRAELRITCADALGLMTEHLEGALSAADGERFRAHLEGCEACGVYLDQLRLTVRVTGTVAGDDAYGVDAATMAHLVGLYRRLRGQGLT